ncbi:MAG: Stage II sporulation protein R [Thermoanaerobacterales bacterium 50_218]|nr:MAG: Stage II sporulation protein R [Thermoanaerobacterales bacterium 50_218]HAA90402.1 stage II sporulation protein R [Peptococcaceae bacterium]
MREKRKAALFLLVVLVGWICSLKFFIASRKAYTPDNLIRFHVIANSNNPHDQETKYRVRDALMNFLEDKFKSVSTCEEAYKVVASEKEELLRLASAAVADTGSSYPVRVDIGEHVFPTRAYGKLVLPAGKYQAVKVILGNGEGANWWCVLFPPLCFVDVSGEATETSEARETFSSVRMRLYDWLQKSESHLAKLLNS